MKRIDYHLKHIVAYTIDYFENIKKKFGKGKERKTELRSFEDIVVSKVVVRNEKLFVNIEDGFAGTSLKKDEFVGECSDIDDVIFFRKDGTYLITKVSPKIYIGKKVIHIAIFKKKDKRTIYNAVYRDGKTGVTYMKRFFVTGTTRDKEYNVTMGTERSEILYFTANPNGEAEILKVMLRPKARLKKRIWEEDLSKLSIKGRASKGNVLTKNPVHKIVLKEEGVSTLGGRKIWYDADVNRINDQKRGEFLGEFKAEDKILIVSAKAEMFLGSFELTNHYQPGMLRFEKYNPATEWTAVFFDAEQGYYYLKRFNADNTDREQSLIGDDPKSKLILLSSNKHAQIKIEFGGKNESREDEIVDAFEFIAIKGLKARGKRLTTYEVKTITEIEPKLVEETEFVIEDTTNEPENTEANFDDPDFEVEKAEDDGSKTLFDM